MYKSALSPHDAPEKVLAEVQGMANSEISLILRKKAVEAVHESTEMLKQEFKLLKSGNPQQAEDLQKAARAKRYNSMWLMRKANKIERDS